MSMSDQFVDFSGENMREPTPVVPVDPTEAHGNVIHDPLASVPQVVVYHADDISLQDHETLGGSPVPNQEPVNDWSHDVYFPGTNATAFPVVQRSSSDYNAKAIVLSAGAQALQILGRVVGRMNITLSVPTTFTNPIGGTITPAGDTYQLYSLNLSLTSNLTSNTILSGLKLEDEHGATLWTASNDSLVIGSPNTFVLGLPSTANEVILAWTTNPNPVGVVGVITATLNYYVVT